MKSLELRLARLELKEPSLAQLEVLDSFNDLTEEDLRSLTSGRFVKSEEAGMVIEFLGFPKLYPYRSQLLEFLQDMNWPAAGYVARLLASSASMMLPEIRRVLQDENDPLWHYWILLCVVPQLNAESLSILKETLLVVIQRADIEGASIEALRLISEQISPDEFAECYQYLNQKFESDYNARNDLVSCFRETFIQKDIGYPTTE